jgi:DNA-directed RNA polymerase subunit beta'
MPIPLWRSYAEGMTPAQYFAASYGQRKNAIGTKFATADAGFAAKRLANAAHRFVVTRELPTATRLPVGLPVPTDDKDSVGAVLAYDAGPVKAGTVLTSDHLDDIKDAGIDEILLHSTMTEPSEDGGVSRLAAGKRLGNDPPPIGENIGLQSAQTIGEKLSQGMLSSKHKAANSAKANKSGIEYLNRLLDAPEHFPEAGPLSEEDGVVGDIVKAPQGGNYMQVGTRKYYVPAGVEPIVKPGDHVEQGDELTDGTPHPEQLVRLRGLGEARRVYLQHFREALTASGAETHRRNLEPVVAGLLNWAKVTTPDGIGDNVYDDVVPFNRLSSQYKPRANAVDQDPDQAVGQYMEEPALHYTPGTRITKKVAKHLKKWGVKSVFSNKDTPDFEPQMIRSMLGVYHDPDWRTKLLGFYTSAAFTDAVHRGGESDLSSTSYAPALAKPNVLGRHLSSLGKYGQVR